MKTSFAVLVAAGLAAVASGCSKPEEPAATPPATPPAEAPATPAETPAEAPATPAAETPAAN